MPDEQPTPLNYAPPQRKQWRTLTIVIVTVVATLVLAAMFVLSWSIIEGGRYGFPSPG